MRHYNLTNLLWLAMIIAALTGHIILAIIFAVVAWSGRAKVPKSYFR